MCRQVETMAGQPQGMGMRGQAGAGMMGHQGMMPHQPLTSGMMASPAASPLTGVDPGVAMAFPAPGYAGSGAQLAGGMMGGYAYGGMSGGSVSGSVDTGSMSIGTTSTGMASSSGIGASGVTLSTTLLGSSGGAAVNACSLCRLSVESVAKSKIFVQEGRSYHVEHFRCVTCLRPFTTCDRMEPVEGSSSVLRFMCSSCKRGDRPDNMCYWCNTPICGRFVALSDGQKAHVGTL